MIVFELPVPPSVNETRRVDWKGYKKLKAWREKAGKTLWLNGQHKQPKITGPFEIRVVMSDDCRIDLDNCLKSIVDFCKVYQFIKDDSPRYMWSISLRFCDGLKPKTCHVYITPIGEDGPSLT